MGRKRGLIIVHPSVMGPPAFDVFGDDEEWGYKVEDCKYVKEAGRDDYSWSEDLCHIPSTNLAVQERINELIRRGFEVKFVGWDEYNPLKGVFRVVGGKDAGRRDG